MASNITAISSAAIKDATLKDGYTAPQSIGSTADKVAYQTPDTRSLGDTSKKTYRSVESMIDYLMDYIDTDPRNYFGTRAPTTYTIAHENQVGVWFDTGNSPKDRLDTKFPPVESHVAVYFDNSATTWGTVGQE